MKLVVLKPTLYVPFKTRLQIPAVLPADYALLNNLKAKILFSMKLRKLLCNQFIYTILVFIFKKELDQNPHGPKVFYEFNVPVT